MYMSLLLKKNLSCVNVVNVITKNLLNQQYFYFNLRLAWMILSVLPHFNYDYSIEVE